MDTKAFLQRVLPRTPGVYFGALFDGSKMKQSRFDSVDALVSFTERAKRNHDVYYATGTFKRSRSAADCAFKRSLYLDLDCGPGKSYANKKDAVTALVAYSRDHFLPPCLIVDSGNGIHAYWTFTEDAAPARWHLLAEALKASCKAAGFITDAACTADAARIMRVPNTVNFKHSMPRTTTVMHDSGRDYQIEVLEGRLAVKRQASLTLAVDNDDLTAGVAANRTYSAAKMVATCPMYMDAMATGGADIPEQLWTQQLHVLAYCEDGETYAFKISEGYESYAETETRMKWNSRLASKDKTGPTRCTTFAQYSPHCATCKFNGQISTPLLLGSDRDAVLPYPYNQDAEGVYFIKKDPDGVDIRVKVFGYQINEFDVYHTPEGLSLRFEAAGKGSKHDVEIKFAAVTDRKACSAALAIKHVVLGHYEYEHFRELMTSWAKRMQDAKQAKTSWPHLGWTDSPRAFVTGSGAFTASGRVEHNLISDRRLAEVFTPKGSRDAWIAAAHLLTSQKRYAIDAAIATAFGSALMPWLRDSSAVVAFVSKRSGTGKSTALEVAQAVWGDPKAAMNQLDDTANSLFRKMAYTCNLPVYWDEIRMKEEAGRFIRLVFQLTGGKERSRLTQQAEMREMGTWNTILALASNESIAGYAEQASRDSEAGRARVFEISVPLLRPAEVSPALNDMIVALRKNYGVIGDEYAQYLAKNEEQLKKLVAAVYERVSKALRRDNTERFWISTVTAMLCGAMIAKKLGFVKTDIAGFESWLGVQFELQRQARNEEYGSDIEQAIDVAADYVSEFRSQLVVCDHLPPYPSHDMGRVYYEPKLGEIAGVVALDTRRLRVVKRVLRDWLARTGRGTARSVVEALSATATRGRVAPASSGQAAPALRVYDIPLPPDVVASYPQSPFEDDQL